MGRNNKKRADGKRGGFEPQIEKIFNSMQAEYKFDLSYEEDTFEVNIPYKYKPDFKLSFPDGRQLVVECKGYFDEADRRKVLSFRATYPEIEYAIVFERNNPVRKNAKMRYMDWAEKHDIKAAVGEVPDEWMRPGDYLEKSYV